MSDDPIVVIVFDDMMDTRDFDDYGPTAREVAPRLIRERNRWYDFRYAHCAVPVCHASRVAMFSGTHPLESGILNNSPETAYIADVGLTWVQQWFRDRGWRTECWGKVFHV